MADTVIKHRGVIEQINGTHLQVKILQVSGCAACTIKSYCTSAESKERIVDVDDSMAGNYKLGQEVWLIGSTTMGMRAVWYGIVIPFLVVVISLFAFSSFGFGDFAVAGASFALLALYYLLLSFNKNRMQRKFFFYVQPIE